MTTESQKIDLLTEFQHYLEQNQSESLNDAHSQPDLNSLLSEITALKTEIKLESRQFKSTLESLNLALETTKEDKKSLELQCSVITQNMLLEMLDIYDHLKTGIQILNDYQPINRLFISSRKKDTQFINRFKQGQLMMLKRFNHLLQHYQIEAIHCDGQLFDPTTMTALETIKDPSIENGIVVEELRTGFLYKKQILRLAEVKVNKLNRK